MNEVGHILGIALGFSIALIVFGWLGLLPWQGWPLDPRDGTRSAKPRAAGSTPASGSGSES